MPTQHYFFRVSSIAKFDFCPRRAAIESFGKMHTFKRFNGSTNQCMVTGTKLHKKYSYYNRDFHRDIIVHSLLPNTETYTKTVGNITIKGAYDDLHINYKDGKKTVSLIELKTTAKPFLLAGEIAMATRQLKLYMWLLKERLERIEYPLDQYSYVEFFSQKTGQKLRTIPVEYDSGIEDWLVLVLDQIKDINKAKGIYYKYCSACPTNTRELCTVYQKRVKAKKLWEDTERVYNLT